MNYLNSFAKWLWQQKVKFLFSVFCTIAFLFLLFPFGDLSDLVTSQVSRLTQNQVYLQFQDMHMSLFPDTGIALEKFHVESSNFPTIKSDELVFRPSISSLIFQKPAGTVVAKGFLRGELEANLSPGKKSDNGVERQHISLSAKNLNLSDLKELARLPLQLNGSLSFDADSQIDFKLQEQPEVELSMKVDKLILPTFTAQTPIGPWPLPEIKVSNLELKGRLAGGKFIIENGKIGGPKDELSGTIKGNLGLTLMAHGETLSPAMGAYQIDIDLQFRGKLHEQLKPALGMLEQFQSATAEGANLKMRLSGMDTFNPPAMSPIR